MLVLMSTPLSHALDENPQSVLSNAGATLDGDTRTSVPISPLLAPWPCLLIEN